MDGSHIWTSKARWAPWLPLPGRARLSLLLSVLLPSCTAAPSGTLPVPVLICRPGGVQTEGTECVAVVCLETLTLTSASPFSRPGVASLLTLSIFKSWQWSPSCVAASGLPASSVGTGICVACGLPSCPVLQTAPKGATEVTELGARTLPLGAAWLGPELQGAQRLECLGVWSASSGRQPRRT